MSVIKRRFIKVFVLVILLGALLVVASQKLWIENYYANLFYPPVAATLRILFGWIPFSIGDILYSIVALWLIYKIGINAIKLFRKKITAGVILRKSAKFLTVLLFFYVVFLIIWGLNYSRKGIAYQLSLPRMPYDSVQLLKLQEILLEKVNNSKSEINQIPYPNRKQIFKKAVTAYGEISRQYPFLKYHHPSVKSSLYGKAGNYLGFTGYYNPFTGEAQVNTTVPDFLIPSITLHEMAHQIGYAKENEANFVGFFVGAHSPDPLFQYSAYLDLLMYANSEIRYFDSTAANDALRKLSAPVKQDIIEWRHFIINHRSIFEPSVRWIYGNFLKFNNQPKGIRSYDMVISLAIAYYRKEGLL